MSHLIDEKLFFYVKTCIHFSTNFDPIHTLIRKSTDIFHDLQARPLENLLDPLACLTQ